MKIKITARFSFREDYEGELIIEIPELDESIYNKKLTPEEYAEAYISHNFNELEDKYCNMDYVKNSESDDINLGDKAIEFEAIVEETK